MKYILLQYFYIKAKQSIKLFINSNYLQTNKELKKPSFSQNQHILLAQELQITEQINSMKPLSNKYSMQEKDINHQLRQIRKQKYLRNMEQKKIFQHLIKNNVQLDLKQPQQSRILANGIPEIYRETVWSQLIKNNHGITMKLYQLLLKKTVKITKEIQEMNHTEELRQLDLIKAKSEGYAASQQLNLNLQKICKWLETIKQDIPRTFSELKIFQTVSSNNKQINNRKGKQSNVSNSVSQKMNSSTHSVKSDTNSMIKNQEQIKSLPPALNNEAKLLFNILTSWVMYRDDIGYRQGMSQIAGYLLIQLNNQFKAFQIFCSLMTTDTLYEFFTMNLEYISSFCHKISIRLRQRNADLYEFFYSNQLDYKLFVLDWILSLFTKCFQLDTIGKVWDLLLLNAMQEKILVNTIVEIICSFQQDICQFNHADVDTMSICRYLKKIKVDEIRQNQILINLKQIKN